MQPWQVRRSHTQMFVSRLARREERSEREEEERGHGAAVETGDGRRQEGFSKQEAELPYPTALSLAWNVVRKNGNVSISLRSLAARSPGAVAGASCPRGPMTDGARADPFHLLWIWNLSHPGCVFECFLLYLAKDNVASFRHLARLHCGALCATRMTMCAAEPATDSNRCRWYF